MTKDQLEENLGTIARSGTSEFLETIESKNAEGANLIGQVRSLLYFGRPLKANENLADAGTGMASHSSASDSTRRSSLPIA